MAQTASRFAAAPLGRVAALPELPSWRFMLAPAALALLVTLAAFYLAHTGNLATSSYSIQRQQSERDLWRMKNEQLRLELAKVQSLNWAEHQAVSRLGMERPGEIIYLMAEPTAETRAVPTR